MYQIIAKNGFSSSWSSTFYFHYQNTSVSNEALYIRFSRVTGPAYLFAARSWSNSTCGNASLYSLKLTSTDNITLMRNGSKR